MAQLTIHNGIASTTFKTWGELVQYVDDHKLSEYKISTPAVPGDGYRLTFKIMESAEL